MYSVLLPDNDRVLHETLMGVMSGIIRPHDGNVMNKSANLLELNRRSRGHDWDWCRSSMRYETT